MSYRHSGSNSRAAEEVPGGIGKGESAIRPGIKKAGGVDDESA
jgi:hypothetical protein